MTSDWFENHWKENPESVLKAVIAEVNRMIHKHQIDHTKSPVLDKVRDFFVGLNTTPMNQMTSTQWKWVTVDTSIHYFPGGPNESTNTSESLLEKGTTTAGIPFDQ